MKHTGWGLVVAAATLIACCVQTANAIGLDLECQSYRPILADDELKRPEAPYCASTGFQFADEFDFNRCRSDMEDYQRKIEGYASCLASENKQAIDKFNEAVQSFNKKASN